MIWFIQDYDQTTIRISNLIQDYYIPKFRISMVVEGDEVILSWNDRERGGGGDQRQIRMDYLDVADGYGGYLSNPSSALQLQETLEAYIISGWTDIVPGGTGDVVGPASATDDNIVLFDGPTGKTIKDSGINITQVMTSQSNQALSGSNGSFTFQTASFGTLNGISFYTSNGSMVASHNAITSQSNQIINFSASGNTFSNTTGSGSNFMISGLGDIDVGLSGNTILFSHARETHEVTAANGSFTYSNMWGAFNSNGVSFLTTISGATSGIIASHNGITSQTVQPAVGLNTAQTNVTWTVNSSGISLNAAGYAGTGTSATNASVTLNSNGLAISVADAGGGATISRYPLMPVPIGYSTVNSGTTGATGAPASTQISASGYINSMIIPAALNFREILVEHSGAASVAGTGSQTIGHMVGIYTMNANTRLDLVSSFQAVMFMSQNSTSARTHHWFWGTNSAANSTAVNGNISQSFVNGRWMYANQADGSLSAGNYYIAYMHTARSSSSAIYHQSSVGWVSAANTTNSPVGVNANLNPWVSWGGIFSTTSNGTTIGYPVMPASIHTSAISSGEHRMPHVIMRKNST